MAPPKLAAALELYASVPEYSRSEEAFSARDAVQVPGDWLIYLSDVEGSTKAIEEGRYRDVNTAGALPVMALANLFGSLEFPFVFGGDGVSLVLPPEHDVEVCTILRDTRELAKSHFGLSLRLGRVPLADLRSRGASLSLVTLRLSERYRQAVFFGDALDAAEAMLKSGSPDSIASPYRIPDFPMAAPLADFTGFSCRWKDIPSPRGLTVALLLRPGPGADPSGARAGGGWVKRSLVAIGELLGTEDETHPIGVSEQKLQPGGKSGRVEAAVGLWRERGFAGAMRRALKGIEVRLIVLGAHLAIGLHLPVRFNGTLASRQRETNRVNADVRKLDGTLKLVLATSPERYRRLESWLRGEEAAGRLIWGVHVSDRALMTCMVHTQSSGEVHFVDSADGGYAMAARMLKSKLKARA